MTDFCETMPKGTALPCLFVFMRYKTLYIVVVKFCNHKILTMEDTYGIIGALGFMNQHMTETENI